MDTFVDILKLIEWPMFFIPVFRIDLRRYAVSIKRKE